MTLWRPVGILAIQLNPSFGFESANFNSGRTTTTNPTHVFSVGFHRLQNDILLLCSGDGGYLDVFRLSEFGLHRITCNWSSIDRQRPEGLLFGRATKQSRLLGQTTRPEPADRNRSTLEIAETGRTRQILLHHQGRTALRSEVKYLLFHQENSQTWRH